MAKTSIENLVRDEIAGLTLLTNYLNGLQPPRDPATVLYPRADEDPGAATPTPFIVARYGPRVGRITLLGTFELFVYDDPAQRYWRIEDIISYLNHHFDYLRFGVTTGGGPQFFRAFHQLDSARSVDDGWGKNYMSARYEVTSSL